MATTHKNQENNLTQKTIVKYDMKSDEQVRATARYGYEIAKTLRDIGLKFKRVIPASTDISVRKQFKLSIDSNLICIELDYNDKSSVDKTIAIGEIKDQIIALTSYSIIDEGVWKYTPTTEVYRLLLKISAAHKNEK